MTNMFKKMLLKYAKKRKAKILIVTKEITNSIKENVIDKGYDYIAICSDGAKGTVFHTNSDSIIVDDKNILDYRRINGNIKNGKYCIKI